MSCDHYFGKAQALVERLIKEYGPGWIPTPNPDTGWLSEAYLCEDADTAGWHIWFELDNSCSVELTHGSYMCIVDCTDIELFETMDGMLAGLSAFNLTMSAALAVTLRQRIDGSKTE